jgi:hypothetical protein
VSSGILSLSAALKMLAQNANAATAEVERTVRVVDSIPESDAVDGIRKAIDEAEKSAKRLLGLRAGATANQTLPTGGATTGAEDDFRSRPDPDNPLSILEQVGQQDLIAEIAKTPMGRYLESYITLLTEKLTKGFALTAERANVIDEALNAPFIGARWIIEHFAGTSGKKFNFNQLETEIKKLVAAQQKLARDLQRGKTNAKAPTSGTVGKPKEKECAPSTSLSVLLQAGALR